MINHIIYSIVSTLFRQMFSRTPPSTTSLGMDVFRSSWDFSTSFILGYVFSFWIILWTFMWYTQFCTCVFYSLLTFWFILLLSKYKLKMIFKQVLKTFTYYVLASRVTFEMLVPSYFSSKYGAFISLPKMLELFSFHYYFELSWWCALVLISHLLFLRYLFFNCNIVSWFIFSIIAFLLFCFSSSSEIPVTWYWIAWIY